ncbi:MAG: hypothetical protein PHD51_00990 [Patescibacteria group bacterium]|nr:hypothetical protein [Patescibacteria group bacterium]MDD5490561.1 hypothetical protein [Patescibacteria group bacterium]
MKSKIIEEDLGDTEAEEEENKNKEKEALTSAEVIKIKSRLENIKSSVCQILDLLEEKGGDLPMSLDTRGETLIKPAEKETGMTVEGVFDGQNMIGPDGKQYSVPANYASKSKLVEGDILKLTITARGTFIYKQIGPVERERLVGQLFENDDTGEFSAIVEDRKYKLLKASVSYFKGEKGDDVVILVPKDKSSAWAAVENVIKK